MYCGGLEKQWSCGKVGTMNLQRVGSIVREIGDPCLYQSSIQPSRILKPEKWQGIFDNDGKVCGFQKVLKLIVLGGIDPSIRPEVWEFLLGCYTLGSTAEYRRHLRARRRQRYQDLIRQCQTMHSSIGTGTLAYPAGSKVMDMRTSSNDEGEREAKVKSKQCSTDNTDKVESSCALSDNCTDMSDTSQREVSSDPTDLVTVRSSKETVARDSSCILSSSVQDTYSTLKVGRESHGQHIVAETCFDIPPLPVTDLFESEDENECLPYDEECPTQGKLGFEDGNMHSFQISESFELIMESTSTALPAKNTVLPFDSETKLVIPGGLQRVSESPSLGRKTETINSLKISDILETPLANTSACKGAANDEKVSEWLWTLHRIVVDVVRTDSHLEFYKDTRNLARMSDILGVYAWVDPATGYCQGMSDLLSPFVVLFEDDADAFWCFEMLIRRMRENFQLEGPTGVLRQLEALWNILELTDKEIFAHLSSIGAESLHFAFPMLLVLFRRELSFNEALCMWEMMWAADFDESMAYNLEDNCLEALIIGLPRDTGSEIKEEATENGNGSLKGTLQSRKVNGEHSISEIDEIKSVSTHQFCGLKRSFWPKIERLQICNIVSSTGKGECVLPVFCVAAILIMNRHKIIRETHSFDDMIKISNDKVLKIHVKRCIRTAIKLRRKYFYKLIKKQSSAVRNSE